MGSSESDAARIGRELEELARASAATHGLSIGVSGGEADLALAPYRDFGVVVGDRQLTVHVGGEVGRPGVLLDRLDSERLLFEYAGAFLQLHREEARPREAASEFVRRVGIDYVRERVAKDPPGRSALFRTFHGLTGCPCISPAAS